MYLAKYIACALVFAAAVVFVARTCDATERKSRSGMLARVLLSFILFALLTVIWYYATVKNFTFKWFVNAVRIVSAVLYLLVLPDIWRDGRYAKPGAEAPKDSDASAALKAEEKKEE